MQIKGVLLTLCPLLVSAQVAAAAGGSLCSEHQITKARSFRTADIRSNASGQVELDFDGDGISELLFAKRTKDATEFLTTLSSTQATETTTLPNGIPAPGDYDGDGRTDYAVATRDNGKVTWTVRKSSTGATESRVFGDTGDTLLIGCRLLSAGKTALAVVSGRKLSSVEFDGAVSDKTSLGKLTNGELLGCGDLTADGDDEVLFRISSPLAGFDSLATVGCDKEVLVFRNIRRFTRLAIVKQIPEDFPIVLAGRNYQPKRQLVDVESFSELFKFPRFITPESADFSSGYFTDRDGNPGYAAVWQIKRSRQIARKFLTQGGSRVERFDGPPADYSLVNAQDVVTP